MNFLTKKSIAKDALIFKNMVYGQFCDFKALKNWNVSQLSQTSLVFQQLTLCCGHFWYAKINCFTVLSGQLLIYRKFPKYLDTHKICCNHSKIRTMWLYHRVMSPNDADGMANSVDPDQTAPLGLHCLPRHNCPKT